MSSLLYYPYINLPENDWTIRALLYYDNIGAIVPAQYFHEPEQYTPFMRKAIENELITPINPMNVLDRPWEVSKRFSVSDSLADMIVLIFEFNSSGAKVFTPVLYISSRLDFSAIGGREKTISLVLISGVIWLLNTPFIYKYDCPL